MSLKDIDIIKKKKLFKGEVKLSPVVRIVEPKTDLDNEINGLRERIEANRERIKQYKNESVRNEGEIRDLENTFKETAERCEFKWYVPKFIAEPTKGEKIKELLYWLS